MYLTCSSCRSVLPAYWPVCWLSTLLQARRFANRSRDHHWHWAVAQNQVLQEGACLSTPFHMSVHTFLLIHVCPHLLAYPCLATPSWLSLAWYNSLCHSLSVSLSVYLTHCLSLSLRWLNAYLTHSFSVSLIYEYCQMTKKLLGGMPKSKAKKWTPKGWQSVE